MLDKLCANHEMNLVVLALLLALLVTSLGKGAGKLLALALKKILGGTEVNISLDAAGKGADKECPVLIDPALCPDHKAEKERSLRNETSIVALWEANTALGSEIRGKLDQVQQGTQKILLAMVSAKLIPHKFLSED